MKYQELEELSRKLQLLDLYQKARGLLKNTQKNIEWGNDSPYTIERLKEDCIRHKKQVDDLHNQLTSLGVEDIPK